MRNWVRIIWYDWWGEQAALNFAAEHGLPGITPTGAKILPLPALPMSPPEETPVNLELLDAGNTPREVLGDGNFGGPYQMDDDLMQRCSPASSPTWSNVCAR